MRRIAGYGTLVMLVNFVMTVWHLYVLGKLHPAMTGPQLVLIGSGINLIPLMGAALLWTRFRRIAGWLLAIFFGAVLVIGAYEHFISSGPDNFFEMATGAWTRSFRASAVLLILVEALGCWMGVRVASLDPKAS